MATLALYGLIALIAVAILFALGVWLLPGGEQIAPPAPDLKPWLLAERPLTSQDVAEIKLPVALRGYRFAETDLLLDRLTEEIRTRDVEIERLRAARSDDGPTTQAGQASDWAPSDWAPPVGWSAEPEPVADADPEPPVTDDSPLDR
jgi:hypothetical protein